MASSSSSATLDAFFLHDPEEAASGRVLSDVGASPADGFTAGGDLAATAADLAREHRVAEDVLITAPAGASVDVRDSAEAWVRILLPAGSAGVVVRAGAWRRVSPPAGRPEARPGFLAPAGAEPFDAALCVDPLGLAPVEGAAAKRAAGATGEAPAAEPRFGPDGAPAGGEAGMTAAELETPYWRHMGAKHSRELVCDICNVFYGLGWASGTGGSISIRHGSRIYMAPSGVQKERMLPQDIYALDADSAQLYQPKARWPGRPFKLSECAPLFGLPYALRGAGACLHSHSQAAVAVTLMHDTEFRVTHLEMIKGLAGHGFHDDLVIPIINNTARECMLTDAMRAAMIKYPRAPAVLVRRHGVYIWGDTWERAKAQAECLHYLFELALRMRGMAVAHDAHPATSPDCNSAADLVAASAAAAPAPERGAKRSRAEADEQPSGGFHGAANPALAASASASSGPEGPAPSTADVDAVVLDIEGTTTPLSFVHETLFPFAREALAAHLDATFAAAETAEDLRALAAQAEEDARAGVSGAAPPFAVPADTAAASAKERADCVAAATAVAHAMMAGDRKVGALKALQGHVWRAGYASGALRGQVFAEVPSFLESLAASGKRVCIYSSGSREAQQLLFGAAEALPANWAPGDDATGAKRTKAAAGAARDLRPRIAAYFDTSVGAKSAAPSYASIALTLGLHPSRVLFATDSLAEASAARAAGMRVAVTDRPGNKPLARPCGFPVVASLADLLAV